MNEQNASEQVDQEALHREIDEAVKQARANPDSAELASDAFELIIVNSLYARFAEALEIMSPHVESLNDNPDGMMAFGFAAWVADPVGLKDLAELSFRRAIALDGSKPQPYSFLTQIYLTSQRWQDAAMAVRAGRDATGDEQFLADFMRLIELRLSGTDTVRFELDGMEYLFALSCFNGQAIEADVHHCLGRLVEYTELKYVKEWLPPVKKIVECGCLVGNHTIFFMKNMKPTQIDLYDASKRSLDETAKNIGLNDSEELDTVINCYQRAIARESGNVIQLLGEDVETISLADAIDADTDFVKVDIDGMEAEALEGLLQGLRKSQARLMIEVKNKEIDRFKRELEGIGYRLANEISRKADSNLFFEPGDG